MPGPPRFEGYRCVVGHLSIQGMPGPARPVSVTASAVIGLVGLASAMGVGRFAFTPLLPLMQQAGTLSLAQGGSLARANYLGYLVGALVCMALNPSPGRAAQLGLAAVAALTAGMGLTDSFPAWVALRLLAGAASAFVLVGVSSWVLPLLASRGRAAWAGWVYCGVGAGIFWCGLVGLATGVLGLSPNAAWLLLAAGSAAVAILCWRSLGVEPPVRASPRGAPRAALPSRTAWLVLAYGAFGFGYIVPATFLPAAARQVVADPAVFAWTWPVFGLAAALSTMAVSRWWRDVPPRRVWARALVVMLAGLLPPALSLSVPTLLWCAVCVGGTFMVATMSGIQEARRVGGASSPRLIAAMTAAFAVGQLVGPFTVTSLGSSASPAVALPHGIAAAVLLLGLGALSLGPASAGTR
jgi:predicted MFS family arabinose efflux permease